MASRKRYDLRKSLGKMFGESDISEDFKKMESNENIEITEQKTQETTKKVEQQKEQQQKDIIKVTNSMQNEVIPKENKEEVVVNPKEQEQSISTKENKDLIYVKINLIQPNLNQPRKNFDQEKLQELSESISKYGILQPLIVKQNGPLYEIIAGERRWRAAKLAGLEEVPVQLKQFDKKTMTEVALIENIQRENLNAVEEAQAYQRLIEEYGLSQEEVAQRVSKNRSTITNSLRILRLNKNILDLIKEGKLTAGHARALLSIEDEELRDKISQRVIEENLNVRDIEKLVRLDGLANWRKEHNAQKRTEQNLQEMIILKDIEKKIKNKLGTKVKIIQKDENEGKIEIKYFGKEDLDRIYTLINSIKEY